MKEKVYLDTTIPSYFFDNRKSQQQLIEITKDWWNNMSDQYDIFISDAVLEELCNGEYPLKKEIIKWTSAIQALPNFDDLSSVVDYYIANNVMPNTLIGDAVHLAFSSYYKIDYLLTWNCNHLANANKKKHIQIINTRLGLPTPLIITPLELFKEK